MTIVATQKISEKEFILNHTSASFTSDNNSLLVVCVDAISASGTQTTLSISSSPSLTWTRQAQAPSNGAAVPPLSEIWTAPVTTGASTTVTVTLALGAGIYSGDGVPSALSITSITGHDTVGNPIGLAPVESQNGSTTGPLSVSMGGTTASDSLIVATVACDGDYGAALVASGSGWTDLYKTTAANSGWFRSTTEYIVGAVSTYDFGALNDPYQHASAALEIKAASGGGTSITPPQGNAVLSPTAPTVALTANRDIASPQGNVALSGTAPTVSVATGAANISPDKADLVLTGNFADVVVTTRIPIYLYSAQPAVAGSVDVILRDPTVLASQSRNISPAADDLILDSVAPTVAIAAGNRDITSPQGNLALSPTAPSRVLNINRDTLQGNLALSPTAPSRVLNINRDTLQGNLALSPTAPSSARTDNRDISSPQGNLLTSPTAPSVARSNNRDIAIPQGNLVTSPTAPSVSTGAGVSAFPPARDLILSPTAPSVIRTDNRDIAVPQGNLVTSPTAPSINISISINPAARDLLLSPTAPSVARTANRDIAIPQGNLATSPTAPSRVVDSSRLPPARDLLLSPTAPTVARTANYNINVPQGNIVLTSEAPSTGGAMSRLPAQGNLVLSPTAPTVVRTAHRDISPASRDLLLSAIAPTLVNTNHHPILVPQGNLRLSTLPAQLIPGTFAYPLQGNLSLSRTAPSVAIAPRRYFTKAAALAGSIDNTEQLSGVIDHDVDLRGSVDTTTELEAGWHG